jgi:CRISPR-associated protein Csm3
MHGRLFNEATLELTLRPQTPLLIKSGEATGLDPSLPDMQFVRTRRPMLNGEVLEVIYIPGSSFRGVMRSHAERLVRSVDDKAACRITEQNCLQRQMCKEAELDGNDAYVRSCYTCRFFGNTGIAARVKVGDFYPNGDLLTEVRHGVAIDRVTGAVAHGPFQMETVSDGEFGGVITLRNFTLGQLGLLAAALLDIGDGLVPLGHAKSRGLGRVTLMVRQVTFRFPRDPQGRLQGVGALADDEVRQRYHLPAAEKDFLPLNITAQHQRGFLTLTVPGDTAKDVLETAVPFWVEQLGS